MTSILFDTKPAASMHASDFKKIVGQHNFRWIDGQSDSDRQTAYISWCVGASKATTRYINAI